MVDDLVEGGVFGGTSPVVLKLVFCLFPRVSPEHTGKFGEVGIKLLTQAERLKAQPDQEFVPFRALIASGIEMIMSAHLMVPAITR